MDKEVYLAERSLLIQLEDNASQSLDKTLLAMSAGALGLSMTFIKQFAPQPQKIELLKWAWVLFIASLLLTLGSLFITQVACRRQRSELDKVYTNEKTEKDCINPWANITKLISTGSIVTFIAGACLLALFAFTNI